MSDSGYRFVNPADGTYVAAYDPEAFDGRGHVVFVTDPGKALVFYSAEDAINTYRAIPFNNPTRTDGKPNRPLTAYTLMLEPVL
jgi:hypothetical protein